MGSTENESEDFCFFWTKIGVPQNLCNAFWLHVLAASIWTGCLPLFSVSRSFQDSPTPLPCPQCVGHTRAATNCEVNRCSFSGLTCISYLWNGRFGPDELISKMFCDRISSLLGNSFMLRADIFPPGIPTTKISVLARKSRKFWRQI